MKNDFLYRSFNDTIDKAYIITLTNNNISSSLSQRCYESCQKVGQNCEFWEAFDGTGPQLVIPKNLEKQSWYKWLKVFDHQQSLAEIATSLSHISLWVKCMEEDRPLIVLEHDAIMVKKHTKHKNFNTIQYLGCKEIKSDPTIPANKLYSAINKNWIFINRAHAYSIDPLSAKKLFKNVLERGIFESADVMIRLEDIAIHYDGLYAYDEPGETTIKMRKK
jgi:hypothetical protein